MELCSIKNEKNTVKYKTYLHRNTFYTGTHFTPEHILHRKTFYTGKHFTPENILHRNTFYTNIIT
jgi:hypothetical protein